MKEYIEILVLSCKAPWKRRLRTPARPCHELRTGQRVQIQGETGEFTILRVDRERHVADLLPDGAIRKIEAGIPLSLLQVKEPDELDEYMISA